MAKTYERARQKAKVLTLSARSRDSDPKCKTALALKEKLETRNWP